MLMYHIGEDVILNSWSIETLLKKVQHGFNFVLIKKGISLNDGAENGQTEQLSDDDIACLFEE